jgi:hypothetical protein
LLALHTRGAQLHGLLPQKSSRLDWLTNVLLWLLLQTGVSNFDFYRIMLNTYACVLGMNAVIAGVAPIVQAKIQTKISTL